MTAASSRWKAARAPASPRRSSGWRRRWKPSGIKVLATREPGGSPGAEEIRKLLVEGEPGRWDAITETLLAYAARADHVARTIGPALLAGTWVICDRFTDSTFAYQGVGRGRGRAKPSAASTARCWTISSRT